MSKKAAPSPLWRVLDANFNRTKEALRVAEDIARFVLNSRPLAAAFKSLRHDVSKIVMTFPVAYRDLLASRDSAADVSKDSLIRDQSRPAWCDLMIANLKRAQEALRVLEEVSKLVSLPHAKKIQQLRFKTYELEKRSIRKF